jgi:hypothetical protein
LWGGGVFGLIPPHFVAAHTKPHMMTDTIAIHTLSNRPLSVRVFMLTPLNLTAPIYSSQLKTTHTKHLSFYVFVVEPVW